MQELREERKKLESALTSIAVLKGEVSAVKDENSRLREVLNNLVSRVRNHNEQNPRAKIILDVSVTEMIK